MEPERGQQTKQDQDRYLECLKRLNESIRELGGRADPDRVRQMANLIIQTMTGPWRFFHTPEHIFEVGERGDAIEVLAALFHDLVYVQVDQGISVNISSYISAVVKEENNNLVIRDRSDLPDDRLFEMVLQIFGFTEGQGLVPTAGQNEFLSAVIAAKCLDGLLTPQDIAQIAACIEATIPFRSADAAGLKPSDRLYQRLEQTSARYGFDWSEADLTNAVKRAVRVANRDVENFAYPSSADFLDNTWNLLPETNHSLTGSNTTYTVSGYRTSLQKMEGFMHFLKPEMVFQHFQGEPDEPAYQLLIARTQRNLQVARLYLGSKLLSIAIIEAISSRIGRNTPVATLMGELPFPDMPVAPMETFLPTVAVKVPPNTPLEEEVLNLLEEGRHQDSSYDIKNSPVTTFIVKSIGFSETQRLLAEAKTFFQKKADLAGSYVQETIAAEAFLDQCNPVVVETITNGILQVFESRKAALRGLQPVTHD